MFFYGMIFVRCLARSKISGQILVFSFQSSGMLSKPNCKMKLKQRVYTHIQREKNIVCIYISMCICVLYSLSASSKVSELQHK